LELYKVTIEYKDAHAHREWEGLLQARRSGAPPPMPPRLTRAAYVAVHPDFGGAPLGRAADLALTSIIGERESWQKFEAWVTTVEHVGSVSVEP
jgi:hypothetical protein